ncbi:hypothetical protein [Desulfoplanes sp.]
MEYTNRTRLHDAVQDGDLVLHRIEKLAAGDAMRMFEEHYKDTCLSLFRNDRAGRMGTGYAKPGNR